MIPEDIYKTVLDKMPVATVDLIILSPDKTKTLLFLRKNKPAKGFYYTIGGRIIKGESPEDAIIRIADTEAGLNLNVKNVKFTGYMSEIFQDSIFDEINSHCINLYFVYKLNNCEDIALDSQHLTCKWFNIEELKLHKDVHAFVQSKVLTAYDVLHLPNQ